MFCEDINTLNLDVVSPYTLLGNYSDKFNIVIEYKFGFNSNSNRINEWARILALKIDYCHAGPFWRAQMKLAYVF